MQLSSPGREGSRPGDTAGRSRTDTLRLALRAATGEEHARLDARLDGMMQADTPRLYHRFVRMNHACHHALHETLTGADDAEGAEFSALTAALDRDMAAMGLSPLALAPVRPLAADPASRAGVLYVVGGSRLGARYLLKAFGEPGPAWHAGASRAYLAGAATSRPFGAFMSPLDAAVTTPEERAAACASARRVFGLFANALDLAEAEVAA